MTRRASRANEERYERAGTHKRNVLLTNQASNKRTGGERVREADAKLHREIRIILRLLSDH